MNESRRRLDHSTLEGNIVKYPKVVVGGGQLVGMAGGRDLSLLGGRAGKVGLGSGPRNRWLLLAGRTVARTGAFLRQGGLLGPEIVKESIDRRFETRQKNPSSCNCYRFEE